MGCRLLLAILGLSSLRRCGAEGLSNGALCEATVDCESGCCAFKDLAADSQNMTIAKGEKEANCSYTSHTVKCLKELGFKKTCQPHKVCKKYGFIIVGISVACALLLLCCIWKCCCKQRARGKEPLQDRYVLIE